MTVNFLHFLTKLTTRNDLGVAGKEKRFKISLCTAISRASHSLREKVENAESIFKMRLRMNSECCKARDKSKVIELIRRNDFRKCCGNLKKAG